MAKRNELNSVTLMEYFRDLREADERARQIKADADEYKDEQHNGLLQQLGEERSRYVSQTQFSDGMDKIEALVKPLTDFMVGQLASSGGVRNYQTAIIAVIAVIATVINTVLILLHK